MKDTPGKKSSRARDGRFHPINKAHAIVEVVFFIQFSREFSKPSLARFSSLRYDLENDLPKFSEVQKLSFAFGPDGSIAQQDLGGIELQRIKRDGNLEWMLRIHENVISVHCLDYTKWITVWPEASKYLYKAFGKIEGPDIEVALVGLKYIDRFVFEGPSEEFNVSQLFRVGDNSFLFPKAFEAGALWHCHTGWFEKLPEGSEHCLNQLNVDAAYTNIAGERKHTITVDHNAIVRFPPGANELRSIVGEGAHEDTRLSQLMQALHSMNKKLLGTLLTSQMAERIRLDTEVP